MSKTVCTVIFLGQDGVAVLVVCAYSAHHQDCHPILVTEYYSAYRLWHLLQNWFHSNSRQKPVADTTVYSVPDDGRKGHPKHVQLLTPNKEHKKSFISLAFIWSATWISSHYIAAPWYITRRSRAEIILRCTRWCKYLSQCRNRLSQ